MKKPRRGLEIFAIIAAVVMWALAMLIWGNEGLVGVQITYAFLSLAVVVLIGLFGVGWWSNYLPDIDGREGGENQEPTAEQSSREGGNHVSPA